MCQWCTQHASGTVLLASSRSPCNRPFLTDDREVIPGPPIEMEKLTEWAADVVRQADDEWIEAMYADISDLLCDDERVGRIEWDLMRDHSALVASGVMMQWTEAANSWSLDWSGPGWRPVRARVRTYAPPDVRGTVQAIAEAVQRAESIRDALALFPEPLRPLAQLLHAPRAHAGA